MMERPKHHGPNGRYRDPWPAGREAPRGRADLFRWLWQRLRHGRAPNPEPDDLPRAEPELAEPRVPAEADELRVTWVGQATFLVQMPGLTLLTDPMFSDRASPFGWAGPRRFSPPGLTLDALPPIDAVLISHDHYDHLDAPTVASLHDRFGDAVTWFTSLGYDDWFGRRGVSNVISMDWWDRTELAVDGGTASITALPVRHWTRRRMFDARKRLWCSWSVEAAGRRLYFGGDSGYCPGFSEIGERAGPFDVALLPVGAYEPRWFMRPSHMNPEEAAQACRDVGAAAMVGMHWGTFRLTDEPPLEPPRRTRQAWSSLGLPPDDLHIPALGETIHF